jgi:hypothetical protein
MRYKRNTESASLMCVRAFPVANGYHLIGFNIGDDLLACWNPKDKQLQTLVPALRLPDKSPALLPSGVYPQEIQIIDCVIPFGVILLPMTDGVYDTLPIHEVTVKIAIKENVTREYHEVRLDSAPLQKELQALVENCSVEQLLNLLVGFSVKRIEELRIDQLAHDQRIQLGDDLAIGALRMSESMESSHHFWRQLKSIFKMGSDNRESLIPSCGK